MILRPIVALFCLLVSSRLLAQTSTLFDVYSEALNADPRVKIAQLQVEMGKAQQDSAFGALLPQASAAAQLSKNDVQFDADSEPDQSYDGERYVFQIRQILFNWRALSERAKAEKLVAQREAELLDVMGLLLVDVSQRYFDVLLADGGVKLLEDEIALVKQQLKETEALFDRNLIPITDYLETQARMDSVQTELIEAKNEAALSREELSALTGNQVGDLAPIRADFTPPSLGNVMEYWTELSLDNNPLLDSRREAVRVALEAVQEQKGDHYPTVDLILSAQRSDIGFDNQVSPQRDTEYIGIDINLPIYSGGSTSARVREAWSQYYIAREQEEATRREILKLTRGAWLTTKSNLERIESAALSIKSANKSYEAMSRSLTFGTVKAQDVLAALHLQTRAERDYQEAIYNYLVSWLTLKRESGTLDANDLETLDGWLQEDNS